MADDPTGTDPRDDEFVRLTRDELRDYGLHVGHAVGRVHRRRVAIAAFLAAFAGALAVAIVFGLHFNSTNRHASQNNARYDCRLVGQLAVDVSAFIDGDATLRQRQARLNITPKLLKDIEKIIPLGDLEESARRSVKLSTDAAAKWRATYIPPLQQLADVDCQAALK